MSQQNVELVRAGFAAFERGEVTELLELLADQLVVYRADPDGATYHGREGFLEATAEWTEGFSEWRVIPQEFIDAGDSVVVRVLQVVRGEASGVSVEAPFWFVFEVHDARVTRLSFYVRELEALEAAGLNEWPMSQEDGDIRVVAEAAFEALNSGDLDAFLALTHEEVEFTSMVAEAEGTTFRGHAGVRAWWDTVRGAFEHPRWEVLELRGSTDKGVAKFRLEGTLGGIDIAQVMWQAGRLRDGKLGWWAFFRAEHEALDAVGLRE
jgi:uncharacterized protein